MSDGQPVEGGDLITIKLFENYELYFEWKISKAGNSGLKYNVSEEMSMSYDPKYSALGFEYQLLDDEDSTYAGNLKYSHFTGSLYDMIPAQDAKTKPVGEFNSSRIIIDGNHVEHWLNGKKVVEYDFDSNRLDSLYLISKYSDFPHFHEKRKAHIVLQNHKDDAWFRNIKIKEINDVNDSDKPEGMLYSGGGAVSIEIDGEKIVRLNQLDSKSNNLNNYVAPGLIDVQINGYMGVDFSGADLTVEKIRKATRALWEAGVTTYFPTIITSDINRMKENFAVLALAKEDEEIGKSIAGFHLEGPYISPVAGYRGAHLEKYIKKPDWEEFQAMQKAANDGIKLITLAPELEGAITFIRKCVESGVVVSLGHHNGTAEEIHLAVDAGARMATHLGNGCANEINRHHNPLWPQLSNDRITPSIIADGFHLTREEVRTFYKVKGPDKTILVSDALDLAGLPPGEYVRGERKLLLTSNVVKLPIENVLAGAASPISKCVGVIMEFTHCSLKDAIQMASTNPARMFSLDDLGEIEQGKRADLIVFSMENNEMVIKKTYVAGKLVYSKN